MTPELEAAEIPPGEEAEDAAEDAAAATYSAVDVAALRREVRGSPTICGSPLGLATS